MSVQFQASAKSKKDKLDFIRNNFSKACFKEGDMELVNIRDREFVIRTGGITMAATKEETTKGKDVLVTGAEISHWDVDKVDEVYDAVLNKSKGKDGVNPFLPILDEDPDDVEEPLEPFHLIK